MCIGDLDNLMIKIVSKNDDVVYLILIQTMRRIYQKIYEYKILIKYYSLSKKLLLH